MRVKALTGFCIGGGQNVGVGEVFECAEEWKAARWVAMGFVVPAEAEPAPPKASVGKEKPLDAPELIRAREPELDHREPRLPRRKGE